MKDLGELHHFLGMHVHHSGDGYFLSQRQYMMEILDLLAGISDRKPCATPVDTNPKLPADGGSPIADPTDFCSLAGALRYLTFTRPDIAYAVQQVCLHMHDPQESHLAALKRILRYVRGTLHLGLYTCVRPLRPILWSTLMLIGLAALTLASPLQVMQYSWATISSPYPQSVRLQYLVRVQKRSIGLSPMLWLRSHGCTYF